MPCGNRHLRGRAELFESPQPERSTAWPDAFISSIQSADAEDVAAISEIYTSGSDSRASMALAPAIEFASPGVGASAVVQPDSVSEQA